MSLLATIIRRLPRAAGLQVPDTCFRAAHSTAKNSATLPIARDSKQHHQVSASSRVPQQVTSSASQAKTGNDILQKTWNPPPNVWLPKTEEIDNKGFSSALHDLWSRDDHRLSIYTDGACFISASGEKWIVYAFCSRHHQSGLLRASVVWNPLLAETAALRLALRSLKDSTGSPAHWQASQISIFTDCAGVLIGLRSLPKKGPCREMLISCRKELQKLSQSGRTVNLSCVPRTVVNAFKPRGLSAHTLCRQTWRFHMTRRADVTVNPPLLPLARHNKEG